MSMETCTMPRSVIKARSVISRRSDILEWTIRLNREVFINNRNESAVSLSTTLGTSAVAVPTSAVDFTPRILPYHVLALPPEIRRIVWQK